MKKFNMLMENLSEKTQILERFEALLLEGDYEDYAKEKKAAGESNVMDKDAYNARFSRKGKDKDDADDADKDKAKDKEKTMKKIIGQGDKYNKELKKLKKGLSENGLKAVEAAQDDYDKTMNDDKASSTDKAIATESLKFATSSARIDKEIQDATKFVLKNKASISNPERESVKNGDTGIKSLGGDLEKQLGDDPSDADMEAAAEDLSKKLMKDKDMLASVAASMKDNEKWESKLSLKSAAKSLAMVTMVSVMLLPIAPAAGIAMWGGVAVKAGINKHRQKQGKKMIGWRDVLGTNRR